MRSALRWLGRLLGRRRVRAAEIAFTDAPFTQISSGRIHTCALRSDGTPNCWGGDGYDVGQATPPAGETFVSIEQRSLLLLRAAGQWFRGVLGWRGPARRGPVSLKDSGSRVHLAAGAGHLCLLDSNGDAACRSAGSQDGGADNYGGAVLQYQRGLQSCVRPADRTASRCVGAPTCSASPRPRPVSATSQRRLRRRRPSRMTVRRSRRLRCRIDHSCALAEDGAAYCWGDNRSGQAAPPAQRSGSALDHDQPVAQLRSAEVRRFGGLLGIPLGDSAGRAGSSRSVPAGATPVRSAPTARRNAGEETIEGRHPRHRMSDSKLLEAATTTAAACGRTPRSGVGARSSLYGARAES